MSYKRLSMALILALALLGAGASSAQGKAPPTQAPTAQSASSGALDSTQGDEATDAGKAAKRLGIGAKELGQIEKILDKNEDSITKARAEIQILQAKIARLMLEKEPAMDQIKALVKESLDWELQVRVAQIDRQVSIRKVVGDERWAGVMRLIRGSALSRLGKAAKPAGAGKEAEPLQRLQSILSRLR